MLSNEKKAYMITVKYACEWDVCGSLFPNNNFNLLTDIRGFLSPMTDINRKIEFQKIIMFPTF